MDKILKWKCDCGKELKSMYPNQLEANKQSHLTKHKMDEEKKVNNHQNN